MDKEKLMNATSLVEKLKMWLGKNIGLINSNIEDPIQISANPSLR